MNSTIHSPASVSVVVAARDAESTLDQTIRSVLSQSLTKLELIICNDASGDSTLDVAKAYRDPRIKVISNDVNHGPGRSRDRAINYATAPWVAIVDADDTLHSDRLQTMLHATTITGADVVFDDTMLCHDTSFGLLAWKRLHGKNAFEGRGNEIRLVEIKDYIAADRLLIQPLIRTDFIRKHGVRHSDRRFGEDAEFYLRLALAGAKFCYVPEPLYNYRISPGSLTAQAKDPSLMRRCLEDCAQWPGWSDSELVAFKTKAAALRRNEALYELRRLIRSGRIGGAVSLILSEPRLLHALPGKLMQQLGYQTHRLLHGGRER